jgi:anti-sigma B factor antagonist
VTEGAGAGGALRVRRDDEDGRVLLTFAGDLDLSTLPDAEREVRAAEAAAPAVLVVDLSELDFIDSSGVRLVLQAQARARESGRRLAIALGSGRSLRLFEVLGLVDRLDVVAGRDDGA